MNGIKDLIVWRKSYDLAKRVYELTSTFPTTERYGLRSQMCRAAVSIPSNIAEGYRRRNRAEVRHFARIAFGSASELETQVMLAKELDIGEREKYIEVERYLDDTLRLLNRYCDSLA